MHSAKSSVIGFVNALPHLAVGLVALGGLLKVADLGQFGESLKTWSLLPNTGKSVVLLLVPSLELCIGMAWLVGDMKRRDSVARVAIALLSVFTISFVVQGVLADVPDCGCFGKLLAAQDVVDQAQVVVARNLSLIAAILLRFLRLN